MRVSRSFVVMAGFVVLFFLSSACAKPPEMKPLPAHPFPTWVDELESGQTNAESIRMRFGDPFEIQQNVLGEKVWRYVYREIRWPKDDPMRPVVGADGRVGPSKSPTPSRFGKSLRATWNWIDGFFFFPPRQNRPPRMRRLPATVHHLELVFSTEGTLNRFIYAPEVGSARVTALR